MPDVQLATVIHCLHPSMPEYRQPAFSARRAEPAAWSSIKALDGLTTTFAPTASVPSRVSGQGIFNWTSTVAGPKDFYDPHVSIDYSTCPPRFVMAMECALPGEVGVPSLCTSYTTTPSLAETWSTPKLIVEGLARNINDANWKISDRFLSASTGVTLSDGKRKFVKWTEIDDGERNFWNDNQLVPDEGFERARSKGAEVSDFFNSLGSTQRTSTMVLDAQPNVVCKGAWDCNNRDVQDWKVEDGQYYSIYNGANYFRCQRPDPTKGLSSWAIGVARSSTAVGGAQQMLSFDETIRARLTDTCGINYPMINAINGELYVYYGYKDRINGVDQNLTARGALKRRAK